CQNSHFITLLSIFISFFFEYVNHRDLHSFPTRRSSDLGTRVILLLGLVVFVWGLDLGVTGAAWTDAVACIGTAFVLGIVLGSVKAWCMPTWDSTLWRRVAVFALAVHAATVAAYLNYRVDEFIVAAFVPVEQLG